MKKFIPIFSLAFLMVACTSNPNNGLPVTATPQVPAAPVYNPDTAGLAQFQQWKAANELASADSYKKLDMQRAATPVKKIKKAYPVPNATTPGNTSGSGNTASGGNDAGTMSSESENTAKAPEKKGISKAAKGTAIGAGAGAVAGAVIGKKNRVVGGVIGGVVGGAVGYGIGRHMDKKDGRY